MSKNLVEGSNRSIRLIRNFDLLFTFAKTSLFLSFSLSPPLSLPLISYVHSGGTGERGRGRGEGGGGGQDREREGLKQEM